MAGPARPPRRSLWQRVRRLVGVGQEPPRPSDPPDDEPALVPTGPPSAPRRPGTVALEPPEPPEDVDARGTSSE